MTESTNPPSRPSTASAVLLIARREVGQYASTWSGYIITAGLLFVLGLAFNVWAIGLRGQLSAEILHRFIHLASGITLVGAALLATRQIAEERSQGTYPLLATSSLTEGQVVLAKYLGAMVPVLTFLLLSLYMPISVYVSGRISISHIAAGYVGLMLIGSAGVAIGLFGSAVARSQLVAVVISLVLCGIGVLLWTTADIVDGWLGQVVAGMTLHGRHFFPFRDGVISTANILYYVSVTLLFLMLARNALETRRWRP